MRALVVAAGCLVLAGGSPTPPDRAQAGVPTIDDLISLVRSGSPEMAPNGSQVAYTVRSTNWDEDAYETEIWLVEATGERRRQLTNAPGSSSAPAWSPDGRSIAFRSDRSGSQQLYRISPDGGEAVALTDGDQGVGSFAWSPSGDIIAFTRTAPVSSEMEAREEAYGVFERVDREHRLTQLHVLDLATGIARRLTDGDWTVGGFAWSPDGTSIAFDHRRNSDPSNGHTADISLVTVADGTLRALVTQDGPDASPRWSPDGSQVAFVTSMGRPDFYYANSEIAVTPAAGGPVTVLTAAFDEDPNIVAWRPAGLFFSANLATRSYLFRLDPASRQITRSAPADGWVGSSFSLTAAGDQVAFVASTPTAVPEIYVSRVDASQTRRLTDDGAQVTGWPQHARDVVRWSSQDGTAIEGVLHRPADYQPGRRYPLLVVIHGGPTGVSRPIPFGSTRIYPIDLWLARGAIVLEPNYRGSAGYGEAFRSLNVRNLGVGDAWDVISGVDYLIGEGMADAESVGVMGWSQGGYISAFLTTHDSGRFKAVSVGAGISNWVTYYVNTDIHPFTRQYLQATPWEDPEIYAKTSPMTYITQASAPTLIQHGVADRRVPPPNAYELYQGLQDQHVETELIIYRGFGGTGHGPTAPKSSRALMQHNLDWFDRHLFADLADRR